jgi:hypothetical protein
VRERIESMILEQNVLSPVLSFRILGKSATVERPNTYLWMITSNLTAGTTDFISRAVPIRLYFEGDPKTRRFAGDPLTYASRHRLEILGELAGMVLRWVQQGRASGAHQHRCARWAAVIGGILDAAGVGDLFLANAEEAEAEMDQGLLDLATLAEYVVSHNKSELYGMSGTSVSSRGKTAADWVHVAAASQILQDKLDKRNAKSTATTVGKFLGGKLDRTVVIETGTGSGTATLRRREAGAGQKLYWFEVAIRSSAGDGRSVSKVAGTVASSCSTAENRCRAPGKKQNHQMIGAGAAGTGPNGQGDQEGPEWH